jgi:hypothetical protein
MNRRSFFELFVASAVVAVHARSNSKELNASVSTRTIVVGPDNAPISDQSVVPPLSLAIGLLGGSIRGHASGSDILLTPFRHSGHIDLDLGDLALSASVRASKIDERSPDPFKLTPEATEIATLVPHVWHGSNGTYFGLGRFIDPLSDSGALLVFFDRACEVRGKQFGTRGTILFDAEIPEAGLHFLSFQRVNASDAVMKVLQKPRNMVLAVQERR